MTGNVLIVQEKTDKVTREPNKDKMAIKKHDKVTATKERRQDNA